MSEIVNDVPAARCFREGESSWENVCRRVADYVDDTADEMGQNIPPPIFEPGIKNAQSKIIEKTGKYYEYEKKILKLEKVE